jgi:hypothetical protein
LVRANALLQRALLLIWSALRKMNRGQNAIVWPTWFFGQFVKLRQSVYSAT